MENKETIEEDDKWSLEKAQEFALERFKKGGISGKGIITWESILEVLKVGVLTGHKFGAKWQSERSYSPEEVKELLIECCGEVSCEDGLLVGKSPSDLYHWISKKITK